MKSKINIMVVTTGRADYGLLYPLIKKIEESSSFELSLIVTGTHLSRRHGETIKLIKKDAIKISGKIKMTLGSDTEDYICRAISSGLSGFSKLFSKKTPDLLIVLGDRYELWSVCIPAVIHKIPIVHISGGEITLGAIDDSIRHSVTKMSSFHFPSIELYARRIIQMGETANRVFVVGALGLDNIKNISLMSRGELMQYTGVDFDIKTALMTFHPVTLDNLYSVKKQIKSVLNAIMDTDLFTIITMPNSDTSGDVIYKMILDYSGRYPEKFKLIKNLGTKAYLSAMQFAKLMIGNSSSGIIESASFKLPVVNIGDRQGGRFKPANVIDCNCTEKSISKAIDLALSDKFNKSISILGNPYGDGNTATRIVKVLEAIDFNHKAKYIKKGFYDLKQNCSKINLQKVL